MRKPSEVIINGKTLEEILENHLHWLKQDVDGWKGMRANLRYADLSHADLRYANLSMANLSRANLSMANLSRANLSETNLSIANLSRANLSETNLSETNLSHADLSMANLSMANLSMADLSEANLSETNLRYANLRYADLRYAKNIPYIPLECPSEGAFVGWKKVNNVLIKLEIPADAKRSSATTNKCRCDKAKVLGFYDSLGVNELDITELVNDKYEECKYVKGEMVYPDSFDEDRWNECSHGIHFFINKQDAINYNN